jgi:hypothetical protein
MRWISAELLLASLLIGLAHIAGLPATEGMDEIAHYSYIQQIAKTGTVPRFGDKMFQDAEDARNILWENRNVLADPKIIKRVRQALKVPRDPAATGKPGDRENWEVEQQPPFYYMLLTPAYLLSERWSLVGQFALLRGLSYLAAWLSLCFAVFVADKSFPAPGPGRAMVTAPALWPFVFPGWFPEMARIGNDSLVALLVASAIAVIICAPIRRWSTWLLLGAICGLGALTKLTFLPFLAAIALLLLYRTWWRDASPWKFLGFLASVLAVAGWWYFQRSVETGMLFATPENLWLSERGGLIAGLMEHFSVDALAWAIPAAGMSFLWMGTQSYITPPLIALAPLVVLLLLISWAYLVGFHSYRMYPLVQITPLALGIWCLAISYPILVLMGLYGRVPLGFLGYGGYPGWYLHSFAPALAPVIGIAITTFARNRLVRTVVCLLLAYDIVFLFGATFMQFLSFTGCGLSNFNNRFHVAYASECWNDWQRLTDILDADAYPWAALWLVAGGAMLLGLCLLTSVVLASSRTNRSKVVAFSATSDNAA